MPNLRYGGKKGSMLKLAVSTEYVAVRMEERRSLDEGMLSLAGADVMAELEPMFQLPAAGVEVHRVRTSRGREKMRDRARVVLAAENEVMFAGRVLCEPATRIPVLYTENLFVKLAGDCAESACRKMLEEHGLTVKRTIPWLRNGYFVAAPAGMGLACFDLAERLLREVKVELCHPELVWEGRRRALFPQQWHLHKTILGGIEIDGHIDAEGAWASTRGEGVTIAILDDGFDLDHVELAVPDKIVAPRDLTLKTDNPRPQTGNNHGTSCAGVACAEGLRGASGVAPRAKLLPVRLASGLGSQDEADAIVWAAEHGADVISCSWGPEDGDWRRPEDPRHQMVSMLPDSTRLALEHATDHGRGGKGCVITWAAGNGNESVDNDGYASCERVLAVAACNESGRRSVYSDFGRAIFCAFPSNDFSAPDRPVTTTPGIWTIDRSGAAGFNPGLLTLGDRRGHFTNEFKGTSSACPGAAGVAALVLSVAPHLDWREVKDVLRRSCDPIDLENGDYDAEGHSPFYGFGRINAARAVKEATAMATPALPPAAARALGLDEEAPPSIPRMAEITITFEGEADKSWLCIDDCRLELGAGAAKISLELGRRYVISWWLCGAAGAPFSITIDPGENELVGRLPVRSRIAGASGKAAGTRTFFLRGPRT